jgi:hypothetical protein
MRSQWLKVSLGLTVVLALLLVFNNCGEVEFASTLPDDVVGVQGPSEDNGVDAGAEEEDAVLEELPPEEVAAPRPVEDLLDNPELADLYRCADGSSVMICHFPENVEAQGTKCVGINALNPHVDHIRQYNLGDGDKTIGDYLGPCRVDL